MLTRRKVRELHPVSRHVRTTGVTASSWGGPLFSKVSGKLEAGERRVRCALERGSPSHTQTHLHAGLGASVIDFLSSLLPECVCVCVLTVCQYCGWSSSSSSSSRFGPLSPALCSSEAFMIRTRRTGARWGAVSPPALKKEIKKIKKIFKKNPNFFLSPSVMSTWLQGYVITVNLSGKNDP